MIDRDYFEIAIIKAPLDAILGAFDSYPAMRVRSVRIPFELPSSISCEHILWSPASSPELTAVLPGAGFVLAFANTTFRFDTLSVRSTARSGDDGLDELVYHSDGGLKRAVRVMKDPRWVYWEEGEPLSFEDTSRYQLKIKPQRLDRSLLLTYLSAFGADVTSDAFWSTSTAAASFTLKDEWAARANEQPIPCPYCGKLLRTARAKQCQHCFIDWHDAEG
ncbi:hypothetical protein [Luteimonas sp. A478]